jgi:hypothetical protein
MAVMMQTARVSGATVRLASQRPQRRSATVVRASNGSENSSENGTFFYRGKSYTAEEVRAGPQHFRHTTAPCTHNMPLCVRYTYCGGVLCGWFCHRVVPFLLRPPNPLGTPLHLLPKPLTPITHTIALSCTAPVLAVEAGRG